MPTATPRRFALAALAVACLFLVPASSATAQEAPPAATPSGPAAPPAPAIDGGSLGEGAWALIGAVVGAVLASGLPIGWSVLQERRVSKRQRASVRALLRVEVEENLALLRPYWSTLNEGLEGDTTGVNVSGMVAHRMVRQPLPPWSRLMWEAQAASLPAALMPQEIRAMQRHYANLATLATYRERLVAVEHEDTVAEQTAVEMQSPLPGYFPPTRVSVESQFPREAVQLWPGINRAVTELLEQGVPLGPD